MNNTIIPFPFDFLNLPDNTTVIPTNDVTVNVFVNSNQPVMLSTEVMNKINKMIEKDLKKINLKKNKLLKKLIKEHKLINKKQIIIDI
jgi:hypothetical protein